MQYFTHYLCATIWPDTFTYNNKVESSNPILIKRPIKMFAHLGCWSIFSFKTIEIHNITTIFHVFIAINNIPNILQHYIAWLNIWRLRADCAKESDGWVQTQNWQTTAILGSGFSAASGNREITQIRRITPFTPRPHFCQLRAPKFLNIIKLHFIQVSLNFPPESFLRFSHGWTWLISPS